MLQEATIGTLRCSDASGSVAVGGTVSPGCSVASQISVRTSANLDAMAEAWVGGAVALASLTLQLDVTVYEPTSSGFKESHYGKGLAAYSKILLGGGSFYDNITGQPVLAVAFPVSQPDASLFVASLTATAMARASLGQQAQCPAVCIDAEGYGTTKSG